MNIELRNVKYAAFASEETNCFSATVYIDGEKAGEVSNDGKGGADNYHPFALQSRLEEWAKTLPPYTFNGEQSPHNAETAVGELFDDWLAARDLKRLLASRLVYTKPGKRGIWQSPKLAKDVLARKVAECRTADLQKQGAEKVLNIMPLNEAVALFRAEARAS